MNENREDAVLGELVFNSENDWYEGSVQLPDVIATLNIPLEGFASADEAIDAARQQLICDPRGTGSLQGVHRR